MEITVMGDHVVPQTMWRQLLIRQRDVIVAIIGQRNVLVVVVFWHGHRRRYQDPLAAYMTQREMAMLARAQQCR